MKDGTPLWGCFVITCRIANPCGKRYNKTTECAAERFFIKPCGAWKGAGYERSGELRKLASRFSKRRGNGCGTESHRKSARRDRGPVLPPAKLRHSRDARGARSRYQPHERVYGSPSHTGAGGLPERPRQCAHGGNRVRQPPQKRRIRAGNSAGAGCQRYSRQAVRLASPGADPFLCGATPCHRCWRGDYRQP